MCLSGKEYYQEISEVMQRDMPGNGILTRSEMFITSHEVHWKTKQQLSRHNFVRVDLAYARDSYFTDNALRSLHRYTGE